MTATTPAYDLLRVLRLQRGCRRILALLRLQLPLLVLLRLLLLLADAVRSHTASLLLLL